MKLIIYMIAVAVGLLVIRFFLLPSIFSFWNFGIEVSGWWRPPKGGLPLSYRWAMLLVGISLLTATTYFAWLIIHRSSAR